METVFSEPLTGLRDGFVSRWRAPELNSHRSRGLALLNRGWRGILTENDIFTPAELARDPFQQEFIRPAGLSSFAGMVLAKAPGLMLSGSICRTAWQGPYERGETELLNALALHLRAAGEVALRIGMAATRRITDAFTAAGHAIALVGPHDRIIEMSPAFERLLGNGVHVKGGRLGCWNVDADRAVADLVTRATRNDGIAREPQTPVVLPRRHGLRPVIAHVMPVVGAAHDILRHVAAILVLTDLGAAHASPAEAAIRKAFQLTTAEASLAAQIATGQSLPEIARQRNISHETLRSRLKSIFAKTGTRRQQDLILLLSKLARAHP
jgi:DNA-binding CsgD family transcriptional regulator